MKEKEDKESPKPKPCPDDQFKGIQQEVNENMELSIEPKPKVEVILSGESGIEEEEPMTVGQLFKDAVSRFPTHPALKYKEGGKWKTYTYTEYYDCCIRAAKSFLEIHTTDTKLGQDPNPTVAIIGFNSPEWVIAALGAMFAGGVPTGIYATNKPEACHFMADNCKANIIVVENQKQLNKILEIQDRLPHLKAIVQYRGVLSQNNQSKKKIYKWGEFLKLGDEIETSSVEEKIESQKPDQCALLIYTSGTTGHPHGVKLSHDNLTFSAKALDQTYGRLDPGKEHGVSYLPLSHISAQMADIYVPLLVGATVYFAQPDALKGSLGKTLREVKPTFFFGVPRVYELIMERLQEHDPSTRSLKGAVYSWAKSKGLEGSNRRQKNQSLPWGWAVAKQLVFKKYQKALGFQQCKIFCVGTKPTWTEVHEFFMSINIPLMEIYGMSECSGCHTLNLHHNQLGWRVGSCGKPLNGVQLKIIDQDENGEGEICIKGRHVFMGYINDTKKTSEAIDSDGWLHSGDIGKLQDGFLQFTCRIIEKITLSDGVEINPVPIEDSIKSEIPFLSNVMVIGDKKKFLTCLMTFKCDMDPETGELLDILPPLAQRQIQELGSHNTKVSEIVAQKDRAVFTAIQEGLDKANEHATSNAMKVRKWSLLPSDFSIPGRELGPTLKIRRYVVHKKYAETIEAMYSEYHTPHQSDVQKGDSSIPGGELDSNSKPTLPLLLSFPGKSGEINILERIGTTYKIFGIFLLNDASGAKIESITKEESQVADITLKILSRWLQGEGMQSQTWSTLIKVLRKSKLSDLANEIETVITSK